MDALDQSEELTELGRHLADLPVDPHLGKMVLNSIVLKCIDPVLTIVCSLSYKDPCKYHRSLVIRWGSGAGGLLPKHSQKLRSILEDGFRF